MKAWSYILTFCLVVIAACPSSAKQPYFRIMLEDVEASVGTALATEGVAENVTATITSTREKVLHASYRPVHVELATLKYDEGKATWSANMMVKDGDKVVTARPLAGRYEAQQALPVLSKRFKHGHVIGEDDVAMRFFPNSKVRSDTITDPNQIIGKTPQRSIAANRPLRTGELSAPTILESGATVQMRYNTPYMKISTMGEALEDGGIGDFIRVRNHDSNKVVRARIISAQEVAVGNQTR